MYLFSKPWMLAWVSFMWRGNEECLFPLCSKTAFKLTTDEWLKSLHCSGACWSWSSSVSPQTSLQYTLSPSVEKYLAMFNCLFLWNDNSTPFSRRFHCWSCDPVSSALVLARSKSRTRSFISARVIKCGSVLLYAEKSRTPVLLVPASGEASSSSESKVYFSALALADIYILLQM